MTGGCRRVGHAQPASAASWRRCISAAPARGEVGEEQVFLARFARLDGIRELRGLDEACGFGGVMRGVRGIFRSVRKRDGVPLAAMLSVGKVALHRERRERPVEQKRLDALRIRGPHFAVAHGLFDERRGSRAANERLRGGGAKSSLGFAPRRGVGRPVHHLFPRALAPLLAHSAHFDRDRAPHRVDQEREVGAHRREALLDPVGGRCEHGAQTAADYLIGRVSRELPGSIGKALGQRRSRLPEPPRREAARDGVPSPG